MLKKIKLLIHNWIKSVVWFYAVNKFCKNYKAIKHNERLVKLLFYGWGNWYWAAKVEYIKGIVEEAFHNKGTVLECGSGLSTVILGVIGMNRGFEVISLEHSSFWAKKVRSVLRKQGINNVTILDTSIVSYEGYDWYNNSDIKNLCDFSLIICDGPPSETKGGRYGLFPLVYEKMAQRCHILLDDINRQEEQKIVQVWQENYNINYTMLGEEDKYALIECP